MVQRCSFVGPSDMELNHQLWKAKNESIMKLNAHPDTRTRIIDFTLLMRTCAQYSVSYFDFSRYQCIINLTLSSDGIEEKINLKLPGGSWFVPVQLSGRWRLTLVPETSSPSSSIQKQIDPWHCTPAYLPSERHLGTNTPRRLFRLASNWRRRHGVFAEGFAKSKP